MSSNNREACEHKAEDYDRFYSFGTNVLSVAKQLSSMFGVCWVSATAVMAEVGSFVDRAHENFSDQEKEEYRKVREEIRSRLEVQEASHSGSVVPNLKAATNTLAPTNVNSKGGQA